MASLIDISCETEVFLPISRLPVLVCMSTRCRGWRRTTPQICPSVQARHRGQNTGCGVPAQVRINRPRPGSQDPLTPTTVQTVSGCFLIPPSLLIPASRFLSPEFIPPRQRTNPIKFSIERKDMIRRRKVLNIPEFYVGKKHMQILSLVETEKEKKKK